ncbi:MAG: glycosyltransferase family 39 protein [Chloroflexi bacterium]|nr:glycosyltransferase family 39 protein [Chloroflexota bacterium]
MTRSARLGARAAWLLLVPILLAYGYIAVGYARGTPRWNNPDEPAHVNVVRQIARTGQLPVLQQGDWDSELLSRLTTHWFPNDYDVDGIRYEGHQPPLYYLLAAPVHWLTAGQPINRQILALRLFSILIAAVTVVAAFVVAREAAPTRPALAVLTAATVAFIPMNTAISAAVNNDALASALAAVALAALMIGRRRGFSDRWAVGIGVLIGALVLTKLTVYVYVPLILGTLLLAGRTSSPGDAAGTARPAAISWLRTLRWPAIAVAVSLLVAGWWVVRNMLVYGPLDPLAMARHDQIVVGQPRWTSYDLESLDFFFRILFRSFWGMFGWMGVVLDDGFYILYLVLTVLGIAGVEIGWLARTALGVRHKGLLIGAALLVFGEVAYYNLTFIQPQGRYLFPALVPLALFLSSGWTALADRAVSPLPVRLLTTAVLAGAIAWALGEAHGALRASELWSDNALIAAASVGALAVLLLPERARRWLPDGLPLMLALTLGLLDYAALVKFVAPAFPVR